MSTYVRDYGATLFLSLRWDDPRLSFIGIEPIDLRSGSNLLDKIWTPDLYFTNVKEAKIHEVTVTNKHVRIHPDGHVLYDMRVSLVLICHLYLQRFPMDKQTCGIELESFGYTTRDIQLDWDANFSAIIAPEVVMPEFTVGLPVTSKGMRRYPLGYYAQLQCQFSLHRELIFYVMEHYVPSFLLVILSWVSFWLSVDATPARASLGITTVLTLTTLSSTARTSLAKVSYTKAIDIWMLVCSLFVFAALLEFAVASYLHKATDTCDAHKARRRQSLNVDRRTPPHEHELLELTSKSGLQHRNHETRIYMEDSFYDEPPSLRNKGYKLISRRIDRYSLFHDGYRDPDYRLRLRNFTLYP
ncbi:glycine receptor subunit alphaZ1-like [Saccoglossus kowalevskii]